MAVVQITPLKIGKVIALHQLFRQGLYDDFGYFPAEYLRATDRANSTFRLAYAALRPHRLIIVAQQNNQVVGYTISGYENRNEAFIYWVYVNPTHRNAGIGKELMQETLSTFARRNKTTIRLATHNYVDYYKRYGFQTKPKENFSIGDTKMYIMELNLTIT